MPAITDQQQIQDAQDRRAVAEQELNRANAAFRRWQAAVEALGGEGAADAAMLERGDRISREVAAARTEIRKAEGALEQARKYAADEAAWLSRANDHHPVTYREPGQVGGTA